MRGFFEQTVGLFDIIKQTQTHGLLQNGIRCFQILQSQQQFSARLRFVNIFQRRDVVLQIGFDSGLIFRRLVQNNVIWVYFGRNCINVGIFNIGIFAGIKQCVGNQVQCLVNTLNRIFRRNGSGNVVSRVTGIDEIALCNCCLLYTSPSPRD